MRRPRAGRNPPFSTARAIGTAALLTLLSTGTGGLVGWGVSECPFPAGPATPSTAAPDSEEGRKLESLRRSRLAFLNLGLDRKSPFIKGFDEEIAVAECTLETLRVNSLPLLTESEGPTSAEVVKSRLPAESTFGSILGFVLGAIGAAFYGWKGRSGSEQRPGSPDGAGRRLQIPILGTIPEGAFEKR